jgi:hypothetical protein
MTYQVFGTLFPGSEPQVMGEFGTIREAAQFAQSIEGDAIYNLRAEETVWLADVDGFEVLPALMELGL